MARALLVHDRHDQQWRPIGVILATPRTIRERHLPGDPGLTAWMVAAVRDAAAPPGGTLENWVSGALDALTNGHDRDPSVDRLYAVHVLRVPDPPPFRRQPVAAADAIDTASLGGPRAR
jgi:hypothetical protein